ncbi:hypothetical protein C0Q70_11680 [Pomacea canaliculata]|uniref:cGMP-dependent protein kinase interacting domain-containing protein n=1 Tax=Pomacea canaliculata TaxID=400727 RepID=A0A2T7P6R1_POMCA|nr:hypothetical protein C0Q70_11680 [Pomacea canaliculata]
MASSSVSQESLDMEDFDNMARRNRIRTHRGRAMPHRSGEREGSAGDVHDREGKDRDQNGDTVEGVHAGGDHESPTRSAAARLKDKRSRVNHMHKGKLPKDKRKLREKRRSTGVVHLPSTESTGDSLDDDDDDDENVIHETKKNTVYNEGPNSTHHTSYEVISPPSLVLFYSPSDLEADLEDNQDYDSTVSHSETNLTLIGRSESSDTQMSGGFMSRQPTSGFSKFSPESSRASSALKYGTSSAQQVSADQEPSKTSLHSAPKSSVLSLVSRYNRDPDTLPRELEQSSKDSDTSRPSGLTGHKDKTYSRTEKPYSGYLSSRFQDRDSVGVVGGGSNGGVVGSSSSNLHSSRFTFQSARPFVPQYNSSSNSDATAQLEKQLEKEKEENKRLQQQLEQKDRRIIELERQVALLNKECDELDEDNLKLQEENKALIRAMSQLSTNV